MTTPVMKHAFAYLTLAALLAACGSGTPTDDLGRKRAELDSLKTAYKELALRIKETEAWINEHDTTVRRNLPVVTGVKLEPSTFLHYVDVHGVVKADRAAALYAMTGGRVRGINVSVGDRVRQGDVLITIDNNIVADQIKQARTGYELAKTTYEKQKSLWDQKIGSEIQYLQAKAQMESAQAGLSALQEQQRLTNVTAPFDGTVDDIMVRVGDMTSPMAAVARVVDLTGAQLEADMPEGYMGRVKKDAPARVRFPAADTTFEAHIEHVGSFIDPSNRTFKVTVHVPKGSAYIRPNLLTEISVQDSRTDSALVVPNSTVMDDVAGNSYLFVLDASRGDEGTARKVLVKRLAEYKGSIHVRPIEPGALKGGETILNDGARNVGNGQAVRVVQK